MLVKSLGIIGGTFDPPHYGHLLAAEWARCECNLEEVVFMPAARPPHKQAACLSESEDRLEMVKLAVEDNPAFRVSDLEMHREGKSYTVDTIDYLRNVNVDRDIYFIMGADSLLAINTWKDVSRLAGICKFIAISRPGYIMDRNDRAVQNLPAEIIERTVFLEIPGTVISSTDIRERVRTGKSIKYLLPPAVEDYVYRNGLYREVIPRC